MQSWKAVTVAAITALVLGGSALRSSLLSAESGRAIPLPAPYQSTQRPADVEIVVLAGGCFWGVQGVFQHVEGVTSAVSGYAGGAADTAHYQMVGGGRTGHAEAVKITFEPKRIDYGRLLQVYFSVAHDPTQLNRQGPDVGPQYRSAIFSTNAEQARVAKAYIAQLNRAGVFPSPIVTRIESGREFFPAEAYHQDYLTRHPTQPYVAINDLPKIEELKRLFPDLYRAQPVLVNPARPAS
jgi:peptide-methionine (S)-S-oxide reductase